MLPKRDCTPWFISYCLFLSYEAFFLVKTRNLSTKALPWGVQA